MDPLKSVTWEQLTTIVGAAIAFGTFAIGAICIAIVKLVPKIKEAKEAIDSLIRRADSHEKVLEKVAEASDAPTAELLKPMTDEKLQ